ncbi:hypothetical protein NW754_002876 [Fusarium falciforme]|nr:hypothetical protein NW754_002876 [Fusarium falciforme]
MDSAEVLTLKSVYYSQSHGQANMVSERRVPPPVSVSWSLVEPGLQDLSQDCRQYIRYFDLELSKECVVYNNPSANPFLALMPLMPGSHALSHIMVSISAFHFTHRIVINHIQAPSGSSRFPTQVSEDWYSPEDHAWQKNQPNYGNSLSTALSHKQKPSSI